MDYFPIFYRLKEKPCLVVGGGVVAARKIELLIRAGAQIEVIAETVCQSILDMQKQHSLVIRKTAFTETSLSDYKLIVSATNDHAINERVAEMARIQCIPVNVVDNPILSDFIFPALVDRSPVIIAVTSGGTAPVLARLLRAKIETVIPPAYGKIAKLAEKYRDKVKKLITSPSQRRIFWENVFQGPIAERIFSNNEQEAEDLCEQSLVNQNKLAEGEVYLIGAGPGAADLLTFRALRLLQQADIVLYDRLVSPEILDLARRDAEKIYVGKQRKNHALPQNSINQLLAGLARQGKRVARLKGGDPFIFGRGGEEIETLTAQRIPFQVVPGITAASGCASYAGIPLTHRDHAQSCVFVTGHLKNNEVNLNWTQLALPDQTVVIYMGSLGLEQICEALIAHGSQKNLPIALIQQGTTKNQKVLTGTLETMPAKAQKCLITPPTLIIIGTVVKLHDKLNWFNKNSGV